MAGRLIIVSRWIAMFLLMLAIVVIVSRGRVHMRGGNPSMGGYGWYKHLFNAWRYRRKSRREQVRNMRALRGKTVLLVDPDPKSLRVMTWKLEKLGCIVLQFRTGTHALSKLGESTVDAAFVDALLPDISASDFYHALPGCRTPIVFLGVLENQWDTLTALGSLVACLAKPYDPDEAASQAGRLLKQAEAVFDHE